MTATDPLTPEQHRALYVARQLARAGIPIFTAHPDPDNISKTDTGFFLPKGWQKTLPNAYAVDQWKPGMAICAVGGVAADFVDVDVQNNGHEAANDLIDAGVWPDSYGRARTPSGGTHDVIARLHIGNDARRGIDYQGGDDNGRGRGFVFIAPTVKPSKITGEMVAYSWEIEPDIPALKTKGPTDTTGQQFAEWVVVDEKKARTKTSNGTPLASPTGNGDKHSGPIPNHEGHIRMTSFVGTLLTKYPEIELEDYLEKCRARWEQYERPDLWPWDRCLENPVMDCWERFERGEIREGSEEFEPDDNALILPQSFYDSRPYLKEIQRHAHDRCAGADGVLYATLARLSGMVPPTCRVETGVLSPASLNLFVAALGPAGGGKSSSASLSKGLYTAPSEIRFQDGLPLGSGEGLVEAFFELVEIDDPSGATYADGRPKRVKVKRKTRSNAFFMADEGQGMVKMMERSGSVLGETIRSLWVAATAGQANANAETRRIMDEHTYAMGMLVGFQPSTVQPLLADHAGGTPQRYVYCWTVDPTIPDEVEPQSPRRDIFAGVTPTFKVSDDPIDMVRSVKDEIRRTHLERKRGAITAPHMDEHDYLTKAKLAALLALMEDRHVVNEEDWSLASVMYSTSSNVRAAMVKYGKARNAEEAQEKNKANATREGMAESAREEAREAHSAPRRVAKRIGNLVHDQGDIRTVGAVNRKLARRDQNDHELVTVAWEIAESEGWITVGGKTVEPGDQRPA